jgi:hypothetical protein
LQPERRQPALPLRARSGALQRVPQPRGSGALASGPPRLLRCVDAASAPPTIGSWRVRERSEQLLRHAAWRPASPRILVVVKPRVEKLARSATRPSTAPERPYGSMPVLEVSSGDCSAAPPQLHLRWTLGKRRSVFAAVLSVVAAAAAVAVAGSLGAAAPSVPFAARPSHAAPQLTAHVLHMPHVQHDKENKPKWLVSPAAAAPRHRVVYRSHGATVGLAGGFYQLVLTA